VINRARERGTRQAKKNYKSESITSVAQTHSCRSCQDSPVVQWCNVDLRVTLHSFTPSLVEKREE
jgi:hypothetical protein